MNDPYYIKIDGKDVEVPEWAQWLAQDGNGFWWFFKHDPIASDVFREWLADPKGMTAQRAPSGPATPPTDWCEELYKIERK